MKILPTGTLELFGGEEIKEKHNITNMYYTVDKYLRKVVQMHNKLGTWSASQFIAPGPGLFTLAQFGDWSMHTFKDIQRLISRVDVYRMCLD